LKLVILNFALRNTVFSKNNVTIDSHKIQRSSTVNANLGAKMSDGKELKYDSILLVSFGGPEAREEVIPFLESVLRGKNVPRHRLEEVAQHYYLFEGVSPINEHCRRLLTDLRQELDDRGIDLPLFWGNRNWHPLLAETIGQMKDKGCRKAIAFVTSAYSSYSGCRQYLEDIAGARAAVGEGAPVVDKIPVFYDHPDFIQANAQSLLNALSTLPPERRAAAHVAFTAHSLPKTMAQNCLYESQLRQTCLSIAAMTEHANWQLVFQSRSGPPAQPWLEPDICDHLRVLETQKVNDVVVQPLGFLFDHMEVIYDLETEARKLCQELGINFVRAETVAKNPLFVQMVGELIEHAVHSQPGQEPIGIADNHDFCHVDCCQSGASRTSEHSTSVSRS
jgi:protoporphyrin/coproporphyrin ferrochelatase